MNEKQRWNKKWKASNELKKVDTAIRPACSQTLDFLFKVRRARVIKKPRGLIDRQRKEVGVGKKKVDGL